MRNILLVLALGGLLAVALAFSAYMWWRLADVPIGANGMIALVLGALGSLILGGGLMALAFYSSRHGYDERPSRECRTKPR